MGGNTGTGADTTADRPREGALGVEEGSPGPTKEGADSNTPGARKWEGGGTAAITGVTGALLPMGPDVPKLGTSKLCDGGCG